MFSAFAALNEDSSGDQESGTPKEVGGALPSVVPAGTVNQNDEEEEEADFDDDDYLSIYNLGLSLYANEKWAKAEAQFRRLVSSDYFRKRGHWSNTDATADATAVRAGM